MKCCSSSRVMTILYNLYPVSLCFTRAGLYHSPAGTAAKLCGADRPFLWVRSRFKHMPLKLSFKKNKIRGKKKTQPVSMGSLHAMNSTPSLKAEFFQNLEVTNRAPLFQPCSPKRAVPSQTARRGTQFALRTAAKQTPKTVPRNLPRRLKCWQACEQKDRAVNTNLQLKESETNLLIFPSPSSTPFLSSQQSKYRFFFLKPSSSKVFTSPASLHPEKI